MTDSKEWHARPLTGAANARAGADSSGRDDESPDATVTGDGKGAVHVMGTSGRRTGARPTVEEAGPLGGGHQRRVVAQVTAALEAGGVVDIRGKIAEDIPYLTSTWLRSNRDSAAARFLGNDVYYGNHHGIIERLWADPGVTWMVLCYARNPNFILGWMCAEATDRGPVVHYVYVRPEFRRWGFARRLVEAFLQGLDLKGEGTRIWYTSSTVDARSALAALGYNARQPGAGGFEYNHYLLYPRP